jgi:hypothetical protein
METSLYAVYIIFIEILSRARKFYLWKFTNIYQIVNNSNSLNLNFELFIIFYFYLSLNTNNQQVNNVIKMMWDHKTFTAKHSPITDVGSQNFYCQALPYYWCGITKLLLPSTPLLLMWDHKTFTAKHSPITDVGSQNLYCQALPYYKYECFRFYRIIHVFTIVYIRKWWFINGSH